MTDDGRRRLVPELVASMLREPLAQRYMLRVQTSGDNRVRTADDVLGERIVRLAGMLIGEYEQPGVLIMRRARTSRLETLAILAKVALSATPYLWTEEVRAGLRSLDVPRHVLSPRVLPQPASWHTFETGIGLGGELDVDGHHYVGETADAVLVVDRGTGLEVLQFGEMTDAETGEARPTITGGELRYGAVFPDDFDGPWRNLAEGTLMMLAFLASPFIPKKQMQASRAARRESRRLGLPSPDELVTFIILRRPAGRRLSDESASPVEWRHRWLVTGHLRAQWYPSEQAHRLIWIAPYLKGPEDAPMLDHAYKVAR